MSQTFDIKRFGQLVRYDLRSCPFHVLWGALWMAVVFAPLLVLFRHFTGESTGTMYRISMAVAMSLAWATMVPIHVYPTVGKKKRGIYFAMLPATKAEKHLAMATLSLLIFPVVMLAAAAAVDTLLTAIHLPGYTKYFWQSATLRFVTPQQVAVVVLGFVCAVFAMMCVNTMRSEKSMNVLSMALLVLFGAGCVVLPAAFDVAAMGAMAQWAVVAVMAVLAIGLFALSRRLMDRKSY